MVLMAMRCISDQPKVYLGLISKEILPRGEQISQDIFFELLPKAQSLALSAKDLKVPLSGFFDSAFSTSTFSQPVHPDPSVQQDSHTFLSYHPRLSIPLGRPTSLITWCSHEWRASRSVTSTTVETGGWPRFGQERDSGQHRNREMERVDISRGMLDYGVFLLCQVPSSKGSHEEGTRQRATLSGTCSHAICTVGHALPGISFAL